MSVQDRDTIEKKENFAYDINEIIKEYYANNPKKSKQLKK